MVGVLTNHHLYNFTNHHNDSEMKMNHPDVHNTRAYAGVHDAYDHDRYHLHLLCAKHFLLVITPTKARDIQTTPSLGVDTIYT